MLAGSVTPGLKNPSLLLEAASRSKLVGVNNVCRETVLGYTAGVGRGLLGVVGLPLSGALGLVGAVSSGLASTAGLAPAPAVRRPARSAGMTLLFSTGHNSCMS